MEKIFENHKIVRITDLRDKPQYPRNFVEHLMHRDFSDLKNLPVEIKSDINYMEPILYAVKNEFDTYEIYSYYPESLQANAQLGAEIVRSEPHLIEKTPLGNDSNFIIQNIEVAPQLAYYMDSKLKDDPVVVEALCSSQNLDVLREVALNCDAHLVAQNLPELCNNRAFIGSILISKPQQAFILAGDNIRNDYNFLKQQSSLNEQIIDIIVSQVDNFGLEGIKGVQESSKSFSLDHSINTVNEMAKKSDDKRYIKVQEYIDKKGKDSQESFVAATAMAAQNENLDPASIKQILNYSVLTMEKLSRQIETTENYSYPKEDYLQLVSAINIRKLRASLEKQGVDLPAEIKEKLDQYEDFYHQYFEKFREHKRVERLSKESQEVKQPELDNAPSQKDEPLTSNVSATKIPFSEISDSISSASAAEVQKVTVDTKQAVAEHTHEQTNLSVESEVQDTSTNEREELN